MKVCLLFKPRANPDEPLAVELARELRDRGHMVFMDRRQTTGLAWVQEIEGQIRDSDLVVLLLSANSVQSELLACEAELAEQAAQQRGGCPELLPVRVHFKGRLPESLAAICDPLEFEWNADADRYVSHLHLWNSPDDDRKIVELICERLKTLADGQSRGPAQAQKESSIPRAAVPAIGGAVPLDSSYYIVRPTDAQFQTTLERRDSLVLVKGARQMGKTSLLARGLHESREAGCAVVLTDLQKLPSSDLSSIQDFWRALCDIVAQQLGVDVPLAHQWQGGPGPNRTFEDFWRYEVLEKINRPVLWACDEFDRLLTTRFAGDVCGLLRSWHNERVLDPESPWSMLTVGIAYATEAHLFITDLNQSPFNVGTRLLLEDFTLDEVAELNRRYAEPLKNPEELKRFYTLLGGQPFLCQSAFAAMTGHGCGIDFVEAEAEVEDSIFGDHLRRLLVALTRDLEMTNIVAAMIKSGTPPPLNHFYRLRSAGVLAGTSPKDARLRCELYQLFLQRHLD